MTTETTATQNSSSLPSAPRLTLRTLFTLMKAAFKQWSADKAPRLGAALAYYSMLSLGPLLLLVCGILGLVYDSDTGRDQLVAQINGLIGGEGAKVVRDMLNSAAQKPSTGIVATVVGIAVLLVGASGVFGQLQEALNIIWKVQPKPGGGIRQMIQDRFLSFTMVIGTGFLLLISLVISAGLAAFDRFSVGLMPGIEVGLVVINAFVSFGIVTMLFALLFKYVPDVKLRWRDVWLGAVITATLFTIGKFAIGLYLGHSNLGSTFGAAGSLVVMLVWVYYSAQILFFGAEFTYVYTTIYSKVIPGPGAERSKLVTESPLLPTQ